MFLLSSQFTRGIAIRFLHMEVAMIAVTKSLRRSAFLDGAVAAFLMCLVVGPEAQPAQPIVSDPLQGFSQDLDKALKIEGRLAQFQLVAGVVAYVAAYGGYFEWAQAVLGNTTIRCRFLTIHYAREEVAGDVKAAEPLIGNGYIRKLNFSREVTITYRDQTATADDGVLDMRAKLGTLTGDVVLTRGQDVLRGAGLVADLATGTSRMEPPRERR
jgi:lipopolysaccharide export system protein LptA